MTTYTTIDYLPDLDQSKMTSAQTLIFAPYDSGHPTLGWDNRATYYTSEQYAILRSTFIWNGVAGATYDIASSSFFEPFIIQVYDSLGNVVATSNDNTYGSDYVLDFAAPYTGTYYVRAGWNQGYASSHRFVSVSIYEDVDTIPLIPIYGTISSDYLRGTSARETIIAYDGNDTMVGGGGNDLIHGGDGVDTAIFAGDLSNFTFETGAFGLSVTDITGAEGVDTVDATERLQFDDKSVALDIDGAAGKAYRLYQAAFDRAPDLPGLGYWINSLDLGYSLLNVATGFYNSAEFKGLYGSAPSNADLLNRYYQNVLHRTPDQDGYNWWLDVLDRQVASPTQVLMDFSDSAENRAQVIGSIQSGIEYAPWAG